MELVLYSIEKLIYIYEEVFWTEEFITILQSFAVFAFTTRILKFASRKALLLYLSAVIGTACMLFGDIGFWSDNDVLKFIAPTSFFLLYSQKNQHFTGLLLFFLVPYLITSLEFYRNISTITQFFVSHTLIVLSIVICKENKYLAYFVSFVIGLLINHIGSNSPPGYNDIIVNPVLITLCIKGLEFYTKNNKYNEFLKSFWITLLCFAYLGSWIFYYTKPLIPFYNHP